MRSLKRYIGEIINESILDDEDVLLDPERDKEIIKSWIEDNCKIRSHLKINDDLTVDCSGGVTIKNCNIESLTNGLFRWGKIGGGFDCSQCDKLISLEGAPKEVKKSFNCDRCKNLKSLECAPEKVGGNFSCSWCRNLKSLKGAPRKIEGDFSCSFCDGLISLEGAPKEVGRHFSCSGCENLRSLEGAPVKVGEDFECDNCKNLKLTDYDLKKYKIES